MNGVDRTRDSKYSLLPPGKGQSSKGDNQQNLATFGSVHSAHRLSSSSSHSALSKTAIIVIVVAAVLLIVGIFCIFFLVRCISRRNNRRRVQRFGFKGVETAPSQVYQPLSVPAPQGHPGYNDPKSFGGYGYYGSGTVTQ
jgi:hypothetical protein